MTNMAPNSHKKDTEKPTDKLIPTKSAQILNKIEDFDNIVVMSGTASRKPLEKNESILEGKPQQKNNFKDSILKLRAPFYKSHYKQAQTEERIMTKSCELLLGCIKPYMNIKIAKKTKVTESVRIGNVLKTTNVVYERKATRKVHFLSFDGNPSFSMNTSPLRFLQNEKEKVEDEETETSNQKPLSSEDFITKVIPQRLKNPIR